jgi:serine/threonine-protein kinase
MDELDGDSKSTGRTARVEHQAAEAATQLLERLRRATAGEYDIHSEIARGGMASVYLAHDIALDRKVAIKLMSPAMVFGPGMADRFKREARTAGALSHPNIIPVYTVREVDGLCFFVMKLVEGTTLDGILEQVALPPIAMVEAVITQAGNALGYAHRRGVVHRDVKPGNILIDSEGWVVVTDFGIAKIADGDALTLTGTAVGTPAYMSPEQCFGGEIGPASDQYSLGVIAFEMLAGRRPFPDRSPMAMMYAHANTAPPSLAELRRDCPEKLESVVLRMLAKDPAARWPSMEDVVRAVGGGVSGPDESTRGQLGELAKTGTVANLVARARTPRSPVPLAHQRERTVRTPASARPPRRRRALALVAAAVVIVVGGLTYRWWPAATPTTGGSVTGAGVAAPVAPITPVTQAVPSTTPSSTIGDTTTTPVAAVPPARPLAVIDRRPDRGGAAVVRPEPAPAEPSRAATPPAPDSAQAPPPPPPTSVPRADSVVPKVAIVTAPTPPPTVAPAPVDARLEVEAAIERYRVALESGDIARVQRAYPGMTAAQRDGLVAFFSSGGSLRARWSVRDITVTGDAATATATGTNRAVAPRTQPSEQAVKLRFVLERQSASWRLTSVTN